MNPWNSGLESPAFWTAYSGNRHAGPGTIGEILRFRAERQPERRAYTFIVDGEAEETSISYGELDARARGIAQLLVRSGLRNVRALLLYPPGLDFIVGLCGCFYAGLVAVPAYLPDPARPGPTTNRLVAIAADAEATVALTINPVLSELDRTLSQAPVLKALKWVATDRVEEGSAAPPADFKLTGEGLALLQYTSGSTGKPKGVTLTHANLIHNASMVRRFCEHDSVDKYVSWLPAFHDMGFMSGFLQPLYSGIPAVLLSPAAFLQHPYRWLKTISRFRATTSGGPNFAYDLCVRKISSEERASLDLSSWTVAFNGAEPVRSETLEQFAQKFESCGFRREAFYPCYGLAEATLIVTGGPKGRGPKVKVLDASAMGRGQAIEETTGGPGKVCLVGCGRTSPEQRVAIVDPKNGLRCASGEVGEIWVSGASISQGYWKKPDESEQTFRGYVADTGEGPFLRTGDLGFLDGEDLFVTGRLKDVIIIRGVNHYPQDIELTAGSSHWALRPGCGVAFSTDVGGDERLVVVHEVDDRKSFQPAEIIDCIRRSVAEVHELQVYAVVLVKRGAVPKTSSGKIQRGACRRQFNEGKLDEIQRSTLEERSAPAVEESFIRKALLAIAPEKRLPVAESYILEQVARALRLSPSQLPPDQELSTLGLDSLGATELAGQLESQLGIRLTPAQALAGGGVRGIASFVVDQLDARALASSQVDSTVEPPPEYPLSFTQKAFWFFYQLAPQSAAYNTAFALRISSRLDTRALANAFQRLIDHHPCLRSTFGELNGQPVQRVHPSTPFSLRELQASSLQWPDLERAIAEEAYQPFDLERGPVYRVRLYTQSPDEHVLLLTLHHMVMDGWSFWLLLNERTALYRAEKTGTRRLAPSFVAQYSDYVRWQSEMLGGPEGERLFEYWKQELSGDLPVLDLPLSQPRPPIQTYSGASYGFELSRDIAAQLKELAATMEATLYMVLLAVFQVLLHRHSGQNEILVGSPISARARREFAGIVGCFFNAVVLRADFSGVLTFEDFLLQVRGKVLGALDHQEYPSHLLAEHLQPVRDPSRPPLFQATFILQKPQSDARSAISFGEMPAPGTDTDLALSFVPIERKHARMELELEMVEAGGVIHGWFHYNKDLFDAMTIARMADHFLILVDGIITNPRGRLSGLPMLTADEIACLAAEQTSGAGSYDLSGIDELFLEQAARTPDKIAAVYADRSMTFDTLKERSGQLAGLIDRLMK